MEHDNDIGGAYFGELLQIQFRKWKENGYHYHEVHLPINGRYYYYYFSFKTLSHSSLDEIEKAAEWIVKYDLLSDHVCWVIELSSRIFASLREGVAGLTFQEWLDSILKLMHSHENYSYYSFFLKFEQIIILSYKRYNSPSSESNNKPRSISKFRKSNTIYIQIGVN